MSAVLKATRWGGSMGGRSAGDRDRGHDRGERASRGGELSGSDAALLIAHDLMSPMTSLIGNIAYALEQDDLPSSAAEALADARDAARRLERMIHALVDVWASDTAPIVPRVGPLDLGELISDVTGDLQPAGAGHPPIEVALPAEPVEVSHADEDLLRRVLENLLDNALRYAPPATRVSVELDAPSEDRVTFRVRDRGPGIPETARARLFERLDRRAPGPGGGRRSHGLGLWFCRLAVEAHGGRIWVEPGEPTGCVFGVELPRSVVRELTPSKGRTAD